MRFDELTKELHDAYFNAESGEMVAMIHLFAIRYASEISKIDESHTQIAVAAGINKSYGTEISKGVKLARYVTVK